MPVILGVVCQIREKKTKVTIDNLIFINGGAYANIKKAIRQWMTSYSDTLPDDLTFELYKNGRGKHIIKADERLDNWLFYFLINYLNCPEGIEHKVEIEGFTAGNNDDIFKNEKLLVYISPDDGDGDNVYVTTSENKNYKVDFGGEITDAGENKPYYLPSNQRLENPEILKINKSEISKEQEVTSKKRYEKRFKIYLTLTMAGFLINLILLIFPDGITIFPKTSLFLCVAVSLWFFGNDEILKSVSVFLSCFLIALGVFLYGYITSSHIQELDKMLLLAFSIYPLTILVVQWTAWKIFKVLLKREPEVGYSARKPADFILTFILIPILIILPILIADAIIN